MEEQITRAKSVLRAQMRARTAALPSGDRGELSRRFVRRLVELPAWRAADRLLLYAPLPTEPNLDLLWEEDALLGKRVAYPRVDGMAIRLYDVLAFDELKPSRWGLREPSPRSEREVMLDDVSLALVPGLVFDAAGGRLGRGGGYYDRLLTHRDPAKTRLLGVGFAFQHVTEPLPLDAHDVSMDEVCTD